MGELTTSVVKQAYVSEVERWGLTRKEAEAEFDKWLAGVKAEAWSAGYHMSRWDARYEAPRHTSPNPYTTKED